MERRSFGRYPIQLDIKLKIIDGTSAEMDAKVVDVSFDGLGIITGEKLPSGTQILIEWQNPKFHVHGEPVVTGAIVDIVKPEAEGGLFRLGVQFSDKDSRSIHNLLNWIRMQARLQKRAQASAKRSSRQKKRITF